MHVAVKMPRASAVLLTAREPVKENQSVFPVARLRQPAAVMVRVSEVVVAHMVLVPGRTEKLLLRAMPSLRQPAEVMVQASAAAMVQMVLAKAEKSLWAVRQM